VFGKIPHFKKTTKGMIDIEKVKRDGIIKAEWSAFLNRGQERTASPPSN
jgi:hypothetical protein